MRLKQQNVHLTINSASRRELRLHLRDFLTVKKKKNRSISTARRYAYAENSGLRLGKFMNLSTVNAWTTKRR